MTRRLLVLTLLAFAATCGHAHADAVLAPSDDGTAWVVADDATSETIRIGGTFPQLGDPPRVSIKLTQGVWTNVAPPSCSSADANRTRICDARDLVRILAGAGNDDIAHASGAQTLRFALDVDGGPGNDTISGAQFEDTLLGGADDDVISGGSEDDKIEGGPGNDTITPGIGNDGLVKGDAGTDTISYDDGRTTGVTVDLADTKADGGDETERADGFESVIGTPFADTIRTTADNGSIVAGAGDDLLDGRGGQDLLDGGEGADTVSYEDRDTGVSVTLDEAANDGGTADGGKDDVRAVERFNGGSGNDTFTGSGADDTMNGNGGNDTLNGSGGSDTLDGGSGGDALNGGDGTDQVTYEGRPAGVTVTVGLGDKDDGGATDGADGGRDSVNEIEIVRGTPHADRLVGDASSNTLVGFGGDDTMIGRAGADTFDGGDGNDTVSYEDRGGEAITANLDGAAGDGASGENDTILQAESLVGGAGPDTLTGNGVANGLTGGEGNDVLTGDGGGDTFVAGGGDDRVEARDGVAEGVNCGAGNDTANVDASDALDGCETTSLAVVIVDNDKDGVGAGTEVGQDCNDADAKIKPGALEIVGNKVDENCDKVIAPYPLLDISITSGFQAGAKSTLFTALTVSRLPKGAKVALACKAPRKKKCPFKKKSVSIKKTTKELKLVSNFKKRKLAVGTVVTVTVTQKNTIGKVATFTVKKNNVARTLKCLTPGAKKAATCK